MFCLTEASFSNACRHNSISENKIQREREASHARPISALLRPEQRDGHRSPVQEVADVAPDRNHPGPSRRQGGPRREDGTQVPRLRPAPQSATYAPYLADPGGPAPG